MKEKQKTVVLGFGAMGSALVKGWIRNKLLRSSQITAVDIDFKKLNQTAKHLKIKTQTDPGKALVNASLVLLAVKPQQMKRLLAENGAAFPSKALVVSIAAGVSTKQIEMALPQGCSVVRVMPNTPALLGEGMAAVVGGKMAKKRNIQYVLNLFSAVGKAVEVREDQMDIVTAVSGSGPAYFFHMVEVMTEAGIKGGLTPEISRLLVSQTALGAARMILESRKTPAELRVQVTSPGGTTQAALETMKKRGFERIVEEAIQSAARRGRELRRMSES
jgi:pyrroline-5-carboxylate reductase